MDTTSGSSRALRVLAILSALTLFFSSGAFAWAVADDYRDRDIVPAGVTLGGKEVGGLTRAAFAERVRETVEGPLTAPVTVRAAGKDHSLPAGRYLTVDVDGMVAEAMAPRLEAGLGTRLLRRVKNETVEASVAVRLTIDEKTLGPWVAGVVKATVKPAVDASVTVAGTKLKFSAARDGVALAETEAVSLVTSALREGRKTVELPAEAVKPKVSDKALGKSILVRRSQRRLWLYDGAKLEVTYPVAVGTPQFPTPRGRWTIVNKRYRPTWRNPGSGWAKGMPAFIGPGPGNPLGTRALDLDASGIRIHGSSNNASIGTAASHGCMRMHMWQVEDLYPRVPVGTRVFIID